MECAGINRLYLQEEGVFLIVCEVVQKTLWLWELRNGCGNVKWPLKKEESQITMLTVKLQHTIHLLSIVYHFVLAWCILGRCLADNEGDKEQT